MWSSGRKPKEDECRGKVTPKSRSSEPCGKPKLARRPATSAGRWAFPSRRFTVGNDNMPVWFERTTRASPITRRESEVEDFGGRPDAGQTYIAGSAVKKGLKPAARRELVRQVRQAYQLNENRACGLIGITRWINRYQSRRDPQEELRIRLRDMAGSRVRYGYRRLTVCCGARAGR